MPDSKLCEPALQATIPFHHLIFMECMSGARQGQTTSLHGRGHQTVSQTECVYVTLRALEGCPC